MEEQCNPVILPDAALLEPVGYLVDVRIEFPVREFVLIAYQGPFVRNPAGSSGKHLAYGWNHGNCL